MQRQKMTCHNPAIRSFVGMFHTMQSRIESQPVANPTAGMHSDDKSKRPVLQHRRIETLYLDRDRSNEQASFVAV